jgi:hypothetical protein
MRPRIIKERPKMRARGLNGNALRRARSLGLDVSSAQAGDRGPALDTLDNYNENNKDKSAHRGRGGAETQRGRGLGVSGKQSAMRTPGTASRPGTFVEFLFPD